MSGPWNASTGTQTSRRKEGGNFRIHLAIALG
jgi:hypothetical protein